MFENFELHGPKYLSAVDWNCPHDRKSVAACLVNGTSVQERARQQSAVASDSTWWERFGFQVVVEIIDSKDSSICGTVYEFNPSSFSLTSDGSAPDYVVTFRGTKLKPDTIEQDLKLDLKLLFDGLDGTSRAISALQAVENLVSTIGEGKTVWVAGHSLGAAIAMLVGKSMFISQGSKLETFLFNPPFTGIPNHVSEKLKRRLRSAKTVALAMMKAMFLEEQEPGTGHKHFDMLKPWVPHMFVNKKDFVCSKYVGHFEHGECMKHIGLGDLWRLASQNSLRSFMSKASGKDVLPLHLLPSANLFVNKNHYSRDIKFGWHRLNQWWRQDLKLEPKEYRF